MRAERVGVVGELRERERLDGRASGAAVAPMVVVATSGWMPAASYAVNFIAPIQPTTSTRP